MNIWNSDISTAPRDGSHVILAMPNGTTLRSYWCKPKNEPEHWCMLSHKNQPMAWIPWPSHPSAAMPDVDEPDHTNTDAAISGHRLALLDGPQAANRSEDEALRGMASGGVQDECAIHPANHFILDDVGGQ